MPSSRAFPSVVPLWLLGALAAGCGASRYIELQIADDRLPLLRAGMDFDGLAVAAQAPNKCRDIDARYGARPLPATLTLVAGSCFDARFQVQATATLGGRPVAQSRWLDLQFPPGGVLVTTATLADLPDPRLRFRTSFEREDPAAGGPADGAFAPAFIDGFTGEVDGTAAFTGERSLLLSGSATSTSARGAVGVAAGQPDLILHSNDTLHFVLQVDPGTQSPTIGIELVLASGAYAAGLADPALGPIDSASPKPDAVGSWREYTVDLTPLADEHLVGILFAFDARTRGALGTFAAHLDDVSIEASP